VELRHPDLLPLGALVLVALAYAAHRVLVARRRHRSVPLANTSGLTELPAYRRALRHHRIRLAVLTASAALLAGASLVGAARPVDTTTERPTARSRDIMLCLDVSGSMAEFDAALVQTFQALVRGFQGERIGLVIFNASAATVFPLTDDYDFIGEELSAAAIALDGGVGDEGFFAGTYNGRGTSLIGDGLATCVTSFDRVTTQRARSLVLATDNHLAGRPLIPLRQAAELAKVRSVRVYGLNPEKAGPDDEAAELRRLVGDTGGQYFTMDDPAAVREIVASVQRQEASLIEGRARALQSDSPAVPIALAGLGLLGLVGATRRWRS
jgi:uncharacterized protein with von Willebrand factor type A (vWA) domain